MGTPDFAVPSLRQLAASRHTVRAVVTNPDRPAGRGRKVQPPPVKVAAQELGLPILQPESPREKGLAQQLAEFKADLFVVVAFSILPRRLLAIPTIGALNLHPSLLPAYRGAAPIIWAVINGESQTGLTTFLLSPRVDAGDILLQEKVDIAADETAGQLSARLQELGAALVVKTADGLAEERITPRPQGEHGLSRAPKLTKADGRIDWGQDAQRIYNLVRGANPYPGAFTLWDGKPLKIHRAQTVSGKGAPGTVLSADPHQGPTIATGDGALLLDQVQPPGKAAMSGADFVKGFPFKAGMQLGDA